MIRLVGLVDLQPPKKLQENIPEEKSDLGVTQSSPTAGVDDHEGRMVKSDLLAIHKQAGELYNMVGEDEQLEGWVQEKVTLAADYINAAFNHLKYEKSKPASVGAGEETPAEMEPRPVKEEATVEENVTESAPEGWDKTVEKMKKHKEIDNPFALAHWMKKKGATPKAK